MQILLTLLTFIALQILQKVSICCATLLFGVCYYAHLQFTARRVIDDHIMVSKFELECLLIIFIVFNSKCKVTCKNKDFKCQCIKTHFGAIIIIIIMWSYNARHIHSIECSRRRCEMPNRQPQTTHNVVPE